MYTNIINHKCIVRSFDAGTVQQHLYQTKLRDIKQQ